MNEKKEIVIDTSHMGRSKVIFLDIWRKMKYQFNSQIQELNESVALLHLIKRFHEIDLRLISFCCSSSF